MSTPRISVLHRDTGTATEYDIDAYMFLVSAARNVLDVRKRCWPGDFISPSGMGIKRQGEVFEPHGLDPTTAKLTQASRMVALAVIALWVWCVLPSRRSQHLRDTMF